MVVAEFARTELAEDVLFFFNCVVITTERECRIGATATLLHLRSGQFEKVWSGARACVGFKSWIYSSVEPPSSVWSHRTTPD